MKQTVIYEVQLKIDREIEQEYDAWLTDHIAEMLEFDGFLSAQVLVPEVDAGAAPHPGPPPEGGRESEGGRETPRAGVGENEKVVRQVQYQVASREHLDAYLSEHADRMRRQGVQRFGDAFSATRNIYDLGVRPARVCQNCGEALRGQYCEECGQRDKNKIISLWELLRDLIGDVFEVDSRLWRTMRPLLFRPGNLTIEYLRGRRVHYTPPLRLYLVTSLIFFLFVFFNTSPDISFNGDPDDIADAIAELEAAEGDNEEVKRLIAAIREAAGDPQEIAKAVAELEKLPGESQEVAEAISALQDASADADDDAVRESVPETDSGPVADTEPESEPSADTDTKSLAENCDDVSLSGVPWADALEERARQACLNLTSEGGVKRFFSDLIDNVPGMMFFFLPVVALIMAALYPLSRRYYVEHLLFFVHYHSFFFLVLTLTVLVARLPRVIPGQEGFSDLLTFVVIVYVPIYLFVAMRRVYGQSRGLTAIKYVVLGVAYFVSLLVSFTAVALITALSV